jgi:hypothetical protein
VRKLAVIVPAIDLATRSSSAWRESMAARAVGGDDWRGGFVSGLSASAKVNPNATLKVTLDASAGGGSEA